jgi:16S rRNA (guanine966-N2)-methyltransferase
LQLTLRYYYVFFEKIYTFKGEKMRIISGKFKSRRLLTLPGSATRPTLDQTKEAIFSSIGGRCQDFVVLDLFGGSGALALEAISRGARMAYIADKSVQALKIIKTNVDSLKVEEQVKIIKGDYRSVLSKLKEQSFDIIFLDPPYSMKIIDEIISFLIENDMVTRSGFIVAEYAKGYLVNNNYDDFEVRLQRTYSNSEVLILQRKE